MKPRISIVVAMDEKRGIGKNNNLMWHISEDLKHFREITSGHPIIMGRKTFDSIGKILPNRTNIIISHDINYKVENAKVVNSLELAIKIAEKYEKEEIFIIGGGQIFKEALPLAQRLYVTLVRGDYGADVFFPDYGNFSKIIDKKEGRSEKFVYEFLILEIN